MASVRQLTTPNRHGKKPWVVEYTDASGKRRRKTPPSGLKKDADRLRLEIERELDDGVHVARSRTMTFGEAGDLWIKDLERRRRIKDRMAGNTFNSYERYYRLRVRPALGHIVLTELTTPMVQKFINDLSDSYKRSSVLHIHNLVAYVLKFCVAEQLIKINPLVHQPVRLPALRAQEIEIPSRDEMRQILAFCLRPKRKCEHKEPRAIRMMAVTLALFSGLRRGELLGLQWSNIDFANRIIKVRHSLSYYDGLKDTKTHAGIRDVPMADPVFEMLKSWHALQGDNPSGFVILWRGEPVKPQKLTTWIWLMMKQVGLVREDGTNRFSLHTLRHAAVSLLIDLGLQPIHIKKIVGHASIKTTMDVYGHLMPEDTRSRDAFGNISQQFASVTPLLAAEASATKTRRSTKNNKEINI